MLAINVSIPNLAVARLQQFRPPQLWNQRQSNHHDWLKTIHPLYDIPMSISLVIGHLQVYCSPKSSCQGNFPYSCRVSAISAYSRL